MVQRDLKASSVAESKTPDNVVTKVNRFQWQVWGLVGLGIILLLVSFIAHFTRVGFNSETVLEWLDTLVGSIGIELLGAGLVAYLVFRIKNIYR